MNNVENKVNKEWCYDYLESSYPGLLGVFDYIWNLSKGDIDQFIKYADHCNCLRGKELMELLKGEK